MVLGCPPTYGIPIAAVTHATDLEIRATQVYCLSVLEIRSLKSVSWC